MSARLNGMVEPQAEPEIQRLCGRDYQQPFLAQSLQDLVVLLPGEVLVSG